MAIPQSSIIQHYTVDLSSNNNFVQVPVPQGDGQNTRYIEMELISNNMSYFDMLELEGIDNFKILIMGAKPDDTQIVNECEVSDDNYILVPITFQMSIVSGKSEYQIVIIDKDKNNQIKSFPLYLIVVETSFDIDTICSSNEFALFTKNVAVSDQLIANQRELIQKQTEQTDSWDNTYEPAIKNAINNSNTATQNTIDKLQEMSEFKTDLEEAEAERVSAENERKTAETARKDAESKRVTAENTRESNETTRKSNEETRKTNEATRIKQESARVTAESARDTAESIRQKNEQTRITQETERVEAEKLRKSNETTRQSQESTRQTNTSTAIKNAETATDRANTAAQRAEDIYEHIQDAIGIDDTKETDTTAWSSAHTKEYIDSSVEESETRKITNITISTSDWSNNKIYIKSDYIKSDSFINIYYAQSSFQEVSNLDVTYSIGTGYLCISCNNTAKNAITIESITIKNKYISVTGTKASKI